MLEISLSRRPDEGDREGNLSMTTIAKYFETLRWRAFEADYAGIGSLFAGDHISVVRAQRIVSSAPIRAGAELKARMWSASLGRTSATFGHELLSTNGEVLASAGVVWVHMTREGTPVELPGSLVVTSEREVPLFGREMEEAPNGAWSYRYAVRASEVDQLQHVNHASYVRYVEDTRAFAAQYRGYGTRTNAAQRHVRSLGIEYVSETHLGSDVDVRTWVASGEHDTLLFELRAGYKLSARARIVLDSSGH